MLQPNTGIFEGYLCLHASFKGLCTEFPPEQFSDPDTVTTYGTGQINTLGSCSVTAVSKSIDGRLAAALTCVCTQLMCNSQPQVVLCARTLQLAVTVSSLSLVTSDFPRCHHQQPPTMWIWVHPARNVIVFHNNVCWLITDWKSKEALLLMGLRLLIAMPAVLRTLILNYRTRNYSRYVTTGLTSNVTAVLWYSGLKAD